MSDINFEQRYVTSFCFRLGDDYLESIENDFHFLERVIIGDKSCVLEYHLETKL